jgi:glc operon protein GlcG
MKTSFWLTTALATLTVSSFAQAPPSTATIIESNKVAAAFAKGMPLIENSQFKVHAGRREAPGIAEIHTKDTDIIHVLEGSATFVTGGTAVEPKTIAPDEIRGKEIQGGEARRIRKGDVIIVPNGVPHWFKQVDGPLVYYVVKVTAAK